MIAMLMLKKKERKKKRSSKSKQGSEIDLTKKRVNHRVQKT
jgi:hypothetical protein